VHSTQILTFLYVFFELLFSRIQGPKLLAAFCCGCKEGDDSSAMDKNDSTSDLQNFKIILQGLSDCVASHRVGLLVCLLSKILTPVIQFCNLVYQLRC